jgi:hypothetical protein
MMKRLPITSELIWWQDTKIAGKATRLIYNGLKIRIRLLQIQLFDPDIPVQHAVPFRLQLQPAGVSVMPFPPSLPPSRPEFGPPQTCIIGWFSWIFLPLK